MKTTYLIILFLGITFLGCSDNFNDAIVSTSIQTETPTNPIFSDKEAALDFDDSYQATSPFLIVSKTITGGTLDSLFIDTSYVNYQGRLLNVHARLKIKDNSFQGTAEFTMILHPEEASLEFYPHMVFDQEVQLSVTYQGIDLKEIGFNASEDIYFVYFDDNGEIEIIDDKQAKVDVVEQTIKVSNAKLSHFSRYGWIR